MKESVGTFLPPFFQRLSSNAPDLLTVEEVKLSIQEELSVLFNSRCSIASWLEDEDATETSYVLPSFFGLLDLALFKVEDPTNWNHLARYIEKCILIFDPRLQEPHVIISKLDSLTQELIMSLSGRIVCGDRVEQCTFPIIMSLRQQSVD